MVRDFVSGADGDLFAGERVEQSLGDDEPRTEDADERHQRLARFDPKRGNVPGEIDPIGGAGPFARAAHRAQPRGRAAPDRRGEHESGGEGARGQREIESFHAPRETDLGGV